MKTQRPSNKLKSFPSHHYYKLWLYLWYIFFIYFWKIWETSATRTHPVFLASMCSEVIDWDFYTFSLFKFPQRGHKQLKVESSRMVKVIVVMGSQSLFLWRQNLQMGNIKVSCLITGGGDTDTGKIKILPYHHMCFNSNARDAIIFWSHKPWHLGLLLIY